MSSNEMNIGLWAVDLAPKTPLTVQTYPERLLKLSQATMVADGKDDGKRQATLFVKAPHGKFAACSLTSQRPTCSLDIFIMESDDFELSVEGNAHIHVIGCLSREMSGLEDGDDDDDMGAMGYAMSGSEDDEDGEEEMMNGEFEGAGDDDDDDDEEDEDEDGEEPSIDVDEIENMLAALTKPRNAPAAIIEEIQENEESNAVVEAPKSSKKSPKLAPASEKKSPKLQPAQDKKSPKLAPASEKKSPKTQPAPTPKADKKGESKTPAPKAAAESKTPAGGKADKANGKRKAEPAAEQPQTKKAKTDAKPADQNAGKGTIKCSDSSCPKTFHNDAAMQQHAKAKHKTA